MEHYRLLFLFCVVIIFSYGFVAGSRKYRIPSIILLIAMGMGFHEILPSIGWDITMSEDSLRGFGTMGLILIVLEGCFELRFKKKQYLY
jgi:cell volume regulation protein A